MLWIAGIVLGAVLWLAFDSSVGLLAFTSINFVVVLLLLQFQQRNPPDK